MTKELTPLSASRIKTLQTCSWIYWAKYHLKVPDTSNDGASRGTVCHLIFELLGNNRHYKHYLKIVKDGTINNCKPVYKLVSYHAKKLNVCDKENMQMIDEMIVNGLNYDFFGEDGGELDLSISEKDFDLVIDEDGLKRYRIKGFIDKLFLYKDNSALIRDFKTSKQVFKGKEVSDNLQDLMYSLAVSKIYPKYEDRTSEFLFLKFDLSEDMLGNKGNGVLRMSNISPDELEGFEYQLTEIQKTIDNFNEDLANSSLAINNGFPKDGTFGGPLVCGKTGHKKVKGEYLLDSYGKKIPNYICPFRQPKKFFKLICPKGSFIKSATVKEDLLPLLEDGMSIEESSYPGCPHWNHEDLADSMF